MARRLLYFMRGNAIALLALFIALGGTTYAAAKYPANIIGAKQLKKNAVTGVKIKSNAVNGAKVANNSLKGADILESSLGKVPSAANADNAANAANAANAQTVGGASLDSLTLGRGTASTSGGGTSSSCDPNTSTFVDCGTVPLTLPRSGRVLIVADAAFDGANSFGYRGDCELTVDATRIGASLAAGTVGVGTSLTGPGYNANAQDAIGLNAVTDPLTAGAHSFSLQCNQAGGTIEFPETYVSAVMLGAG